MAKLTKEQMKLHQQARALLEKETLTFDEKWFILEHWNEGAEHMNAQAGAFFTPPELAADFHIDVCGNTIIDLCAGIGALSSMAYHHPWGGYGEDKPHITCVERNPAYVAIGKKVLPEAEWMCADVFELLDLIAPGQRYDCAIANPPFGRVSSEGKSGPRYSGSEFQ